MTFPPKSQTTKGVLAMIACCTIWGLSPLFYALIDHVPPPDVLVHRTIWSFVFFGLVIVWQGRVRELRLALSHPGQIAWVFLAAAMIAVNWLLFINAVQVGKVSESALGYYMLPLFSILFGLVLFREALTALQWVAVGLAATAVLILTYGLGAAPWISLTLGVTFAIYGVLKKRVEAGPVLSVTAEMVVLLPIALIWLVFWTGGEWRDPVTLILLVLSGPMTATPLILFSYAARNIRLSTVGIMQYLNPSLQFLTALFFFSEAMTIWHAIAFPLIWLALAIYSWVSVKEERKARKASTSVPVSDFT